MPSRARFGLHPHALVLAALVAASAALGGCGQRPTLLTVHARAETRTTPDLAIVTLGVLARGATAHAAQEAQATRMNAVMAAVRAAGVADTDVQTVGFYLNPEYVYRRDGSARITAYESSNTVSIRVHDLSALSNLVDAVVADGANQLQGVEFTYENEEASHDAARAKAVEAARARADAYAAAAKMRVARVVSITEPGGAAAPWPVEQSRYVAMESLNAAGAAPISPGQISNSGEITVIYELR